MNVGIYLYPGAEVLDFSGPFEVFSTAARISGDAVPPFTVFLIGETAEPVAARGGYRVLPDFTVHEHPPVDVLVIAGGVYTDAIRNAPVLQWIRRQRRSASVVATVCTGIFLLAAADETLGCRVTTHWEDIGDLRRMFPRLEVIEGVRWVDAGPVVSSGGISAGLDMSLHLVARLHGDDLAERTAYQMEYIWNRRA
ncbi:DJ-1/PfpI family protein [Aquisalimonas lutea]|uniref:DJ-1/PfpI family protein n=1 Tax=Aquisalimonas lutea TaxID=1327750 RepID=UPI0025B3125B|nr:DJ-1/PfpI family protein [Aquisalimonas lutea]MDN3517559.1 DJ-1/PfpI family protein [Aquisalimonas lutea]